MARTILDEVMGIRPGLIEHNWRTRCATQTGVLKPDGSSAGTSKNDAAVGGLRFVLLIQLKCGTDARVSG
jgi:hypothetical protein